MASGKTFWDRVATPSNGNPRDTALLDSFYDVSQKYFSGGESVLDFGCGNGHFTLPIATRVGHVLGIDTSQGMIGAAQRHPGMQNAANITFMKTDLFDARFKTAQFDAVVAFNVLHYVLNRSVLLTRIHGLLKPGGLFISSTACLGERKSLPGLLLDLAKRVKLIPHMDFLRSTALEEELSDAGFQISEAKNISEVPERFIVAIR